MINIRKFLIFVVFLPFITAEQVPALPARAPAEGCQYWVAPAPEGNDLQPGTFEAPWATLDHASVSALDNFCTIWFKDGIYTGGNRLNERFSTPTTFKAISPYKVILQNNDLVLAVSGGQNLIFEGFQFQHSQPESGPLVVSVDRNQEFWSEHITFRNNIFHDSYNNDLLKIYNGARFVTVESNIFFNQQGTEEHMDVNSVTDVLIQHNIFFNDFVGSGRENLNETKHFIVIKDSNGEEDGLLGSERITVRSNIFLNWQGSEFENFVRVGNDGKPYFEAKDIWIESNLMIGNSPNTISAAFAISGAQNVTFANNTVIGDLPSKAYAFRIEAKDANPRNENIFFYNNIWSDPTGTMGANASRGNEFSDGNPADTENLVLDNNLYWNGGEEIPPGDLVSPLLHDERRVIADSLIQTDYSSLILPRWTGSAFLSGNTSIDQEFIRLAEAYGKIWFGSPAVGRADPAHAPAEDLLGRPRKANPDMGAYEAILILWGNE